MKVLVVVPTYNESENVAELIRLILSQPVEIAVLIVDDNSPDGTADIVEEMAGGDDRVHLMRRAGKMGLGSAYRDGFKYAMDKTEADVVFQMDADFSHDPRSIPEFLEVLEKNDLVLGSRYLKGVTVVNWPLSRLFLSYGANLYTRLITGLSFKDSTGGYKCFRREVLEALDWSRIRSDGYSFQIETTFMALRKGFRIREIPILFVDRRVGVSKMNRRIVFEAVFLVWRLGFSRWLHARPVERDPVPLTPRAREAR
ncbi:MAG: polyprenol monophosphomannose synthase [Candidatus Eisenbacteria sp.]|nr:polyprenol monophosphomannose synthase [Candidatus Eisenbacteria bacterium]